MGEWELNGDRERTEIGLIEIILNLVKNVQMNFLMY